MLDKIKISLAALLLASGVVGFYLLENYALVVRVLSVLAGIGAGVAVAWFTEPGQRLIEFGGEAYRETKKVAWPTRKETFQTTGIVFAFVVLMALFMWLTDKSLEWVFYDLILGWKKL